MAKKLSVKEKIPNVNFILFIILTMRFLLLDLRSPVGPGFPFGPLNTYWMVNVIQLKSCLLVEDTNRSTSSMTFCKSYRWYITYKCSWINDLRNQIDDTISDYHSLVLL